MTHSEKQLQDIVEGALLASNDPLKIEHLQALFDEQEMPERDDVEAALQALVRLCENRGYQLVEVASGWRFQVRQELAPWINKLWEEKPQRYSRALLETLALIAYRQPLTRGDIEDVRGVAVSSHIIKTLSEREWVKVVGHRDVPGRPALYATTRHFLDYFNMKSLDELPSLGELKDIDSLNKNLDFEAALASVSSEQEPSAEQAAEPLSADGHAENSPEVEDGGQPLSEGRRDQACVDSQEAEHEQSTDGYAMSDLLATTQTVPEGDAAVEQEIASTSDNNETITDDIEPERN